jgi:hypothetical protein
MRDQGLVAVIGQEEGLEGQGEVASLRRNSTGYAAGSAP